MADNPSYWAAMRNQGMQPGTQMNAGNDSWMDTFGDMLAGLGQGAANFLGGTDPKVMQQSTMTPQQVALQQWLGQTAKQGLGQFDFSNIRNAANTDWEQKGLPSILSRLTTSGLERSSAVPQMLSQGYSDIQKNLNALEAQYNATREPMFLQRMQMGLAPQFENLVQPGQPSQLIPLIGTILSAVMGNPLGAAGGLFGMFGQGQQQQTNKQTPFQKAGVDINDLMKQQQYIGNRFNSLRPSIGVQQPYVFGGGF